MKAALSPRLSARSKRNGVSGTSGMVMGGSGARKIIAVPLFYLSISEIEFRRELDLPWRLRQREAPVRHAALRISHRVVGERPGAEDVVHLRVVRSIEQVEHLEHRFDEQISCEVEPPAEASIYRYLF